MKHSLLIALMALCLVGCSKVEVVSSQGFDDKVVDYHQTMVSVGWYDATMGGLSIGIGDVVYVFDGLGYVDMPKGSSSVHIMGMGIDTTVVVVVNKACIIDVCKVCGLDAIGFDTDVVGFVDGGVYYISE